jgi:hypothetical protein
MATSSRLAAHRASAPAFNAASEAEMDPTNLSDEDQMSEEDEDEEDEFMTETEANAAIAAARAEGFAEATARANTVLACEHYAGREALATTMLANEKLSADEITTMLAAAPKAVGPAATTAEGDDDAARAEMRKNLLAEQPGATGQAAEEGLNAEADTTLVDNMKARFGAK